MHSTERQPDVFGERERKNNATEKKKKKEGKTQMAMVIEQNACNTSELQSKLKLVNTLKIKVFKKKKKKDCRC